MSLSKDITGQKDGRSRAIANHASGGGKSLRTVPLSEQKEASKEGAGTLQRKISPALYADNQVTRKALPGFKIKGTAIPISSSNTMEGTGPVRFQPQIVDGMSNSAVIQGKFKEKEKKAAIKDLDRIENFLKTQVEALHEKTDRSNKNDMALGVTELRKNHLKGDNERDLFGWMKAATEDGEEPEILQRCKELLIRAEGKANNSNLRIFGDVVGASTWMDWIPVEVTISGQYRTWFTECATKPLLSKDGRFKFNLSGFDHEYCQKLVARTSNISQKEMDRMVDAHEISKTDWEILEVLSNGSLYGRTDFLLFDKTEDTEPTMMKEELKILYGVSKPIKLLSHEVFLELKEKERQMKEERDLSIKKEEEEAGRFKEADKNERIKILKLRYEKELEGTEKNMDDKEVKEAFEDACGEADWSWNNFEEWWGNGSVYFFKSLKK